jgi:hypothetical protein
MKSLRNAFEGSAQDRNRTFLQVIRNPFGKLRDEVLPLVTYVGDSMTDIECLLEADIGIVMSFKGTGTLMETLRRYNITVLHISFWKPQPGKSIWFARDFKDITDSALFTNVATKPRYGNGNYIERWLSQSQEKRF